MKSTNQRNLQAQMKHGNEAREADNRAEKQADRENLARCIAI